MGCLPSGISLNITLAGSRIARHGGCPQDLPHTFANKGNAKYYIRHSLSKIGG